MPRFDAKRDQYHICLDERQGFPVLLEIKKLPTMNMRGNKHILVISNTFQAFSTCTPQFMLFRDDSNEHENKRHKYVSQLKATHYYKVAQVPRLEANTAIH
jgi:hypothetical protein